MSIESLIEEVTLHSYAAHLTDEEKQEKIAHHFAEIMKTLGLDLSDPSLAKTPERVARMYVTQVFSGLNPKNFPEMSYVPNHHEGSRRQNLVFVRTHFVSFCEHHFVPFFGMAHVAYLPEERLVGLSKISRLLRFFANRPQLQERLTAQVANSLKSLLKSPDVAVSIRAQHCCVIARGVQDPLQTTETQVLFGEFETNPALFEDFSRRCHA